jgi:predicted nucleotidyltransferase
VETDFRRLVRILSHGGVKFIVVGGIAASAHGSARLTSDLDIVYRRDGENISRLIAVLKDLHPYPRGAPAGLPFHWDAETITKGLNFTLTTSLGSLDLIGEITGGGSFDDLLPHSVAVKFHGADCLCLDLDWLIKVKRAAGRPKDFEAIAELEAILEEQRQQLETQTVKANSSSQ